MTVITAILAVTNETAEKNEKMKKKKKLNLNNSNSTCPNQTLNSAKCRYWTRLLELIHFTTLFAVLDKKSIIESAPSTS